MRNLIFALGCLLILGLPKVGEAARTWWVDDDGSADFNNIQDAIDSSGLGDTIIVKPGTYNENLRFNHKPVTVTSQDPNDPNIVPSTTITAGSGHCVTFDSNEDSKSVITGFTIEAVAGRGIYCYGTSPTISKNIIRDCADSGIYGSSEPNAAPIISGNTITSNGGYGIYFCNGPITDNTITFNNGGYGIYRCNGPITDNTITSNNGGIGSCNGPITGNIISDNSNTTVLGFGGGLYNCQGQITYNTVTNNYANSKGGGLYYCNGNIGNNIISGNVSRSSSGGGLYECRGTIYNNTFVGNRASSYGGAIYNCPGSVRNNIIAFNEAYDGGGIYGPSQNSYNDFWGNSDSDPNGDFGGGAAADTGDLFVNPLFARDGRWDPNESIPDPSDDIWIEGEYLLKSQAGRWDPNNEFWVADSNTSPCIDAGDPNSDWRAELWPHGKRINMGAYGGTPAASMSLSPVGNVADIDDDDCVDFNDMLLMMEVWLSEEVLLAEDLDRDRIVNLVDFAILAENWNPGPPTPNPMTWATPPYATSSHSIAMIATTAASSDWSDVEYYFEDFDNPQSNSGWLLFAPGQEPMWENTGLTSNTQYRYRVKARNTLNLRETNWSEVASATTPKEDTTKPTPDPMTWATPPQATSPTSILMVAATAFDESGVQYFFQCTTDANYSSPDWQDSPTYEVNSLPKSVYTFVVRARDKSPLHNTTGNSTPPATVDLKPPTPDPMTWATEPCATSTTSIRMVAATASDYSGVRYFFQCTSDANYSSPDWKESPIYELTSLPNGIYTFVVRARDNSPQYNTTADSNAITVDLKSPTPDPMQWAVPDGEPHATSSHTISMAATLATDDSGVEYFFDCTSHPIYSSAWRDSRIYEVNSLPRGIYTFVTRARDKSPIHNTTADSNAVTVDANAPTPDPMLWASGGQPKKVNRGGTFNWWAVMTAVEAQDESGVVEYFFKCTSDGRFSSGWQNSPYYEVKLGGESVIANFKVKARDPSGNETDWSSEIPAEP